MKSPIKIAVSGAAGNIGYSLLFRIASGDMLGYDQPVILQLLDIEPALKSLQAVVMELQDCAFPLLKDVITSADPFISFADADIAILVGSRPRSKGMERSDLLESNAKIFVAQGKALDAVAKKNIKVLVVGNPANTNALILLHSVKSLDPKNITSMMRLDHNRALAQLAIKTNTHVNDIKKVIIWGNHSSTQYPDISHSEISGIKIKENKSITQTWIEETFIPTIQKRGAAIIEARGLSSAASAANAAIDHIKNWLIGDGDNWVSMGVLSDGSYDVPAGVVYGFPATCKNGNYQIVQNLDISEFSKKHMIDSYEELILERDTIRHILTTC